MARKPEATFKTSVHKYLDRTNIYFASLGGGYVAGVPDVYYESENFVLWVEWKFLPSIPPIVDLTNQKAKTKLSPLQQQWLSRAHYNGVTVAVICGCKDGGVIFTGDSWKKPLTRAEFQVRLLSRKELASWITLLNTRNKKQKKSAAH